MQSVNIDLFTRCVAFSMTLRKWGNRRKANIEGVETSTDKSLLRLSKILIKCKEYDEVCSHQGETRARVMAMSVPSFFKKGIQLVNNEAIEMVEAYLADRVKSHDELVLKFCSVYPEKIVEAGQRLGNQFDPQDYPMVNNLQAMFGITWNWIAFGVPENLPQQLFDAEKAKAEATWAEASEQITLCLREGFAKLVQNMVERLTINPGEEPKTFRDSLVGNMVDFIDMFKARNITNDAQLEELVNKAKEVIGVIKPDDLRGNVDVRTAVANEFANLNSKIGEMITSMPVRSFDFAEE